jgi:hypothetical protein
VNEPDGPGFHVSRPPEFRVMRLAELVPVTAVVAFASVTASAQVSTLTQAGYTGLGITPNARLIDWGRVAGAYDRQLPGVVSNPTGDNFVIGFGLLPNLEIAGRLATNSLDCNAFAGGHCGLRDLSASGKFGFSLDRAQRLSIAAGVTDVGGAATNFRSIYGVGTYSEGPLEVSAGLARRSSSHPKVSMAPLSGPFASAAWQPLPWVRGQLEYTDGKAWAGVRLFAPNAWLPDGWTAYIGTNHSLSNTALTHRSWISAGISIPLYKSPSLPGSGPKAPPPQLRRGERPLPTYEALTLPRRDDDRAEVPLGPAPHADAPADQSRSSVPPDDSDLKQLATALGAKGLDDISVGRLPDGTVAVRANNASYGWNSVDALGAALGVIGRTLGSARVPYRIVLTERQIPLVAVVGETGCLREWINNSNVACAAGRLSTPASGALDEIVSGVAWVIEHQKPAWQTLHVSISPVLRTNIGTEVGAFDYSLGARVGLRLPLWAGASIEARRDVPLSNSTNYEPTAAFAPLRVRGQTERLALTQSLRLPMERWLAPGDKAKALRWGLTAITAQASVGRVGDSMDGIDGQVRWEPGEGRHRVTAKAAYLRNGNFDPTVSLLGPRLAKPLLASYRYTVAETRTYLEATAGQFLYGDRGFEFGLRQWFSDVAVRAYYRRTAFSGAPSRQFVGIELSVPIGPRRDLAAGSHFQFGGTPRFSHAVETLVRGGNNAVRPGFGLDSPAPAVDETFNSDRAGLVYFEDNMRRIRDAAR